MWADTVAGMTIAAVAKAKSARCRILFFTPSLRPVNPLEPPGYQPGIGTTNPQDAASLAAWRAGPQPDALGPALVRRVVGRPDQGHVATGARLGVLALPGQPIKLSRYQVTCSPALR